MRRISAYEFQLISDAEYWCDPQGAAIESLARRIQSMLADKRWVYAQSDLIAAVALDREFVGGPRTRAVRTLLRLAANLGLEGETARLVSFCLLIQLWLQQWKSAEADSRNEALLIGIRALREREMLRQYEGTSHRATYIDQRDPMNFAAVRRMKLSDLLQAWREAARPVFSEDAIRPFSRLDILNYAVRRLHAYAYFLAWFRDYARRNPDGVVSFSTADLPAYAAVRAGLRAVYFPHGFQKRSLIFPDFCRVIAFNRPEAAHFRSRLRNSAVAMAPTEVKIGETERKLAVVGVCLGPSELAVSESLIEQCRRRRTPVVIRPHPADASGYWDSWAGKEGVSVDREGTLEQFFASQKPRFMATWCSTAIYDALTLGILTISFEENHDVVFPYSRVSLRWPSAQDAILAALDSASATERLLSDYVRFVTGCPAEDLTKLKVVK